MKTYKFHVKGMHCNSCVVLTESELGDVPEVSKVKASLDTLSVEVTGDFGDKSPEHVARDLSAVLTPHGYALSLEREKHRARWSDFNIALPIAAAFVALFILLQKLGIVNLITASEVSYGTAFAIGLIASVSTCMAVVGGLVLSMSANFAKEGDRVKPQLFFHGGRIASFFILGGAVGAAGATFQLGNTGTFILGLAVGLVLLILGLNLLDIFPWIKRLQPTIPGFIGRRIHRLKNVNHTVTPLAVGVLTFFLPCGFTITAQTIALISGSAVQGALIMGFFALGTAPMLLLIGLSSVKFFSKPHLSMVFSRGAGFLVLFFALYNIYSQINVLGWIG